MPDTTRPTANSVSVPLVNEPWGIFKSLSVARKNLLRILPQIATTQAIVSGETGKRWHMVIDPKAIREILMDRVTDYPKSDVTKNLLKPAIGDHCSWLKARIGVGNVALRHLCSHIGT